MDRMEYQTVVLAALLHDVGKYFQRGALGLAGQHPQLGADFVSAWRDRFAQCVNADVLRTLVQKHHEGTVDGIADGHTRALARLISHADHFSAAERTERAIAFQDFRTTALAPTFVHVRLLSDKSPEDCRLAHSELGRAHEEPPIFPQPGRQAPEHEVNEHIRAFGAAFTELADRLNWKDFPTVYAHLLSLLHRFTWCIASDTQTDPPDLSLYDHLRVTSAIAACLYRFHAEGGTLDDGTLKNPPPQRCAVLVGDLSGIQGYLYHIATVGAGGVARRLRARSFGLQMLAEVASLKVLHAFDLPLANVLMASGGKFYVLLPNLPTASETLTALQRDSDKWLLASFHGELALSLAWMPVADRQFGTGAESGGFSQVLRELYPRLRDQKQRRLHGVLTDARGWQESEFLRPPFPADRSACPSCHRFPAEFTIAPDDPEDKEVCQKCFDDAQLGSRLTRAEFVGFYDRAERGSECLGWTVSVADDPRSLPPNPALVARLNSSDLSHVAAVPAKFAFLTNYVPREHDGRLKPFETIAGDGPLAVIKADVDRLGQVFQDGLGRDAPPSFDTPSRIASLSRQMDYFFSGWMQWLLESEFPGFYAVYSGGDDLLLVGPRAEALELVKGIHDAFTDYARNPEVTLSAGIALVKPKLPFAHTAKLADEALEAAKRAGRNRLSLLGQPVLWDDLPLIESSIAVLERAGDDLRSAFLYRLIHFADLWQQWKAGRNPLALRFQAMLAYTISRNLKPDSELFRWSSQLVGFPHDDPQRKEAKTMDYLGLIAQWVLLGRREKRDAEEM